MPLIKPTAAVATALAACTVFAGLTACTSSASINDSRNFSFAGSKLTIDTREAELVIDNGSAGGITVERALRGNAAQEGKANMSLDGDVLKLWVECSGFVVDCGGKHVVRVPPGIAIELKGSGSRITGNALSGDINAALRNDAAIELVNPAGKLGIDAHTGRVNIAGAKSTHVTVNAGADVNIDLGFSSPPERVEARSVGGYAHITLPAGPETYRVESPGKDSLASDATSSRSVVVRVTDGRGSVKKAG